MFLVVWLGQTDWENHPEDRWVRQSPRENAPAPKLGWEGSAAYDPWHRLWIHHAGHDGIPQGFATFVFHPGTSTWEQRFPPTSPPGVCCVDGANVFDIAARKFVRFPGGCLGHGYQWSRGVKMKDSPVWLYDPESNRWTNMRPPPYEEFDRRETIGGLCPGGTYAENLELSISFGGVGSAGQKNNLHAYDAWANALYALKPSASPESRDGMGIAYDSGNDSLVMFGSQYLSDEKTWIYRFKTNSWESYDLVPHPPGKKKGTYSTIPKMAYDPSSGVILCVVWLGEKDGHETWIFDAGKLRWTRMEPAASPSPSKSRSRNLGYARDLGVFILETTAASGGHEVWTYRYRKAPKPVAEISDLQIATEPGKAALSWKSNASVEIFRAEPARPWELEFRKVGSVRSSSFVESGLAAQAYVYQVRSGKTILRARTQPRAPDPPIVSVLSRDRVLVRWNVHPAKDVTGYNLYRGVAAVETVAKGTPAPWKDNDPEYTQPQVVRVNLVTKIERLNAKMLTSTLFEDYAQGLDSGAVHAYVLRAVNRLGAESGPSPYALTLPSEPTGVLCREKGSTAELKWDKSPEQGIQGYHVYKLAGGVFGIKRVTDKPVAGTVFQEEAGRNSGRYWVTAVDAIGQEGQPSSPAWFGQSYRGFFQGDWHQ